MIRVVFKPRSKPDYCVCALYSVLSSGFVLFWPWSIFYFLNSLFFFPWFSTFLGYRECSVVFNFNCFVIASPRIGCLYQCGVMVEWWRPVGRWTSLTSVPREGICPLPDVYRRPPFRSLRLPRGEQGRGRVSHSVCGQGCLGVLLQCWPWPWLGGGLSPVSTVQQPCWIERWEWQQEVKWALGVAGKGHQRLNWKSARMVIWNGIKGYEGNLCLRPQEDDGYRLWDWLPEIASSQKIEPCAPTSRHLPAFSARLQSGNLLHGSSPDFPLLHSAHRSSLPSTCRLACCSLEFACSTCSSALANKLGFW